MIEPRYVIITDGSSKLVNRSPYSSIAGVIIDMNFSEYVQFSKFIGKYDIAYAELYSVLYAVEYIMKLNNGEKKCILVISDNESAVKFINGTCNPKLNKSDPLNKLRKKIKHKVLDNDMYPIRAFHIKSHRFKVKEAKNNFMGSGLRVDALTAYSLMEMNATADRLAKEALEKGLNKMNLMKKGDGS